MGQASSATKDTRVTKEQALGAVAAAFEGRGRLETVAIEDIVRASPVTSVERPDRWKTTSSEMHAWNRPPPQGGSKPAGPLVSGGQQLVQGGRRAPVGGEAIAWKDAIESGSMTRDARMSKVRAMFDALDKDDSHVVTEEEFVQALMSEGVDQREAVSLFRQMDESHSGHLTVAKFDHYVAVHTLSIVRDTFKKLDESKDRQIQRTEFVRYFLGNGLSKRQASRLWEEMDKNQNGKINFVEYRNWALETLATTSLGQVAAKLGLS
mmetsp:Transcript_8579/g.17790  ORF Transcript_8579/g.17790 Transcript_8579/m.17790 type:complete len:265 (+) Transcript_8579:3-797(+)